MLQDKFGREMTYLRLGVTDVCNLRCFYCMPKNPVFTPKKELLSDAEIVRLVRIFVELGITKVRITGGEPFARPNLMSVMHQLKNQAHLPRLHITTNATLIEPYLEEITTMFDELTISLDSLQPILFQEIRGKNQFEIFWKNIQFLLEKGMNIKLNMVVLPQNMGDVLPMLELTKNPQIQVRFIEQMPFNGQQKQPQKPVWTHTKILEYIQKNHIVYPMAYASKNETATYYQIENYRGKFGIIPAFSRTFCGSCNRIRVNAKGELRTCLYAQKNLNLTNILRNHTSDQMLKKAIIVAVKHKAKDGWQAVQKVEPFYESMHILGG